MAVDFQGLIQSAIAGRLAMPGSFVGFAAERAREPFAAKFYSRTIQPLAAHIVDQNLELAAAAGATVDDRRVSDSAWARGRRSAGRSLCADQPLRRVDQ